MATRYYDECVHLAERVIGHLDLENSTSAADELLRCLALNVVNLTSESPNPQCNEAIAQVFHDGILTSGRSNMQNHKCQPFTRYILLGCISAALGGPTADVTKPRGTHEGQILGRLQPAVNGLIKWHVAARNIRTYIERMQDTPPEAPFDQPVPDTLNIDQERCHRNMTLLSRAHNNIKLSAYATAEGHVQLLAFMVFWHAMTNTPFPNTLPEFIAQISSMPQVIALPALASQVISILTDTSQSDLFEIMKAVLDLAVHISPLALLSQLSLNRFQVSRPNLIEWGQKLGPKPEYIRAAELNFWRMIIGMVSGTSCSNGLQEFLLLSSESIELATLNSADQEIFFKNGSLKGDNIQGHAESIPTTTADKLPTPVPALDLEPISDGNTISRQPLPAPAPDGLSTNSAVAPSAMPTQEGSPHTAAEVEFQTLPLNGSSTPPVEASSSRPVQGDSSIPAATPTVKPVSQMLGQETPHPNQSPPAIPGERKSGRIPKVVAKYSGTTGPSSSSNPPATKRRRVESIPQAPMSDVKPEVMPSAGAHFLTTAGDYWKNIMDEAQAIHGKMNHPKKPAVLRRPAAPTPLADDSVKFRAFAGWGEVDPIEYTFQPDKYSAKMDITLLRTVLANVESRYDAEGIPPHCQPSAHQEVWDGQSRIFVVDAEQFSTMSTDTIQRIYRDRHILVTDVRGGKKVEFDEIGLAILAPLDQDVTIQYAHKKRDDSANAMHEHGTLQDLLDAARSGTTSAMNVLDLPLGASAVDVPPNFRDLATETYSVSFVKSIVKILDVSNSLSWGTGSTKDALSWFHIDDEGLGTSVMVLAGGKFWVLADRIRVDIHHDEMSSTKAFRQWKVRDIDPEKWALEAVHLPPKSVLYMRPCTPHFVLGTAPSIVLGRHFYAGGSMRRCCFGIVHTFILSVGITNTSHDDTKTLLHRVMAFWYRHLILYGKFQDKDPHVPDIRTVDGLLDIIAVGCILEYATALDRDRYLPHYDPEKNIPQLTEEGHARMRFRVIMKTFSIRYTTAIGGMIVHPSYIWNRILVRFGAALVTYMRTAQATAPKVKGVHAASVSRAVQAHLLSDHPHLVPCFEQDLKDKPTALSWEGPQISITPRPGAFNDIIDAADVEEPREWAEDPLFIGRVDEGVWSEDSDVDE